MTEKEFEIWLEENWIKPEEAILKWKKELTPSDQILFDKLVEKFTKQFIKEERMSDNKKLKGPVDDSLINLNQDYEVQYWSKTLNVVPSLLREAVEKSGSNSVETVRNWLIEEDFIDA